MNHRYALYYNGRLVNVSNNYRTLRLSALRFASAHSNVYIIDTATNIKYKF